MSRMSRCGSPPRCIRKLSRIVLRMRFRSTARFDTRRDMATPSRAQPCEDGRYSATNIRVLNRWLCSRRLAKSRRVNSRALRGRLNAAIAGRRLRDKTLTTLGAACIEHRPATAGFHASTETMRARVFEFSGLKSAFHDKRSKGGKRPTIMRQISLLCQRRLAWRAPSRKDRLPAPPVS